MTLEGFHSVGFCPVETIAAANLVLLAQCKKHSESLGNNMHHAECKYMQIKQQKNTSQGPLLFVFICILRAGKKKKGFVVLISPRLENVVSKHPKTSDFTFHFP